MQIYVPFSKSEETHEGLIVEGIASTETLDAEDEVVDYDTLKAALPDYSEWGNIRVMHQPIAAGIALAVTPDDETRTVYLKALITDANEAHKVRTKTYKGFSIAGNATRQLTKRADGSSYTRRLVKSLHEISLVDRPANPDAKISLFKGADMADETPEAPAPGADTAAIMAELRKLVGGAVPVTLSKASADPTKIVAMIQAARNELELAGDMDGASLMTQAIALVQQASGEANEPEPADEPVPDPAAEPADDVAMAAAAKSAKPKSLRKAGRAISGDRVGAMHTVVKTLLQLLAGTGDAVAQKALGAYGPADDGAEKIAKAARDAADALTPIAKVLVHLADRVEHLEQRPAPGGPVLRAVQKVIGTPRPEPVAQPATAGSAMLAHMAADLLQKAHTAATPAARAEFQRQYDELTKS